MLVAGILDTRYWMVNIVVTTYLFRKVTIFELFKNKSSYANQYLKTTRHVYTNIHRLVSNNLASSIPSQISLPPKLFS